MTTFSIKQFLRKDGQKYFLVVGLSDGGLGHSIFGRFRNIEAAENRIRNLEERNQQ